jgi:eukaryotic-like serine/threonine-protein kinase
VIGWSQVFDGELVEFRDFFLGRHEVTNAEFETFVAAGGYRTAAYWEPIVDNGEPIPWEDAMARFTDRTGRPGPSTWEAGDYPAGQDDLPVSGVSWYEAAAYARFAAQELPTVHHWRRGLAPATLPWVLPASNFGAAGPVAVSESGAMSDTGALDMLGNVREWTATAIGDQHAILGYAWNEPYYPGQGIAAASPLDRSVGNGLRLAITEDEPRIAMRARAPIQQPAGPARWEPVSDDVYAAYGRMFAYEPAALNAVIDATEPTRTWTRQRITFDAAYRDERMVLYLYLPTTGEPPYQTVIYWPGASAVALDSIDEYSPYLDFIVKNGRAVAFPVYKGTFERGDRSPLPGFNTTAYRDNVVDGVKDLRRSIDYLETRPDIDRNSIAFFGHSWGGLNGATALAQESRIKTAVVYVGFLPAVPMNPEVDPVNALPRVEIPTLMLSGEFDSLVPLDTAKRYFDLIGAREPEKGHVIAPGGHFVPRDVLIRETLEWLDKKLGPPRS